MKFACRSMASDQEAHSGMPDDEQNRRRVRPRVRLGKISQLLAGNAEQATANCANQKAQECWLSVCVKRECGRRHHEASDNAAGEKGHGVRGACTDFRPR